MFSLESRINGNEQKNTIQQSASNKNDLSRETVVFLKHETKIGQFVFLHGRKIGNQSGKTLF